jgi:hypothetical protein
MSGNCHAYRKRSGTDSKLPAQVRKASKFRRGELAPGLSFASNYCAWILCSEAIICCHCPSSTLSQRDRVHDLPERARAAAPVIRTSSARSSTPLLDTDVPVE